MLKLHQTLIACGFTPSESKIYLTLLQNNNLKAGQIAKLSNIKRASAYTTLDTLIKKGLVSVSAENGILFFHAEPPVRIREHLESQRQDLDKKVRSLEHIQKELELMKSNELNIPKISIFTGESGVRTLLEQTFDNNKETVLAFGEYVEKGDPIPFYTSKRIGEKVKAKLITPKSKKATQESARDKKELRKTSFIPKNYALPASIHVSGNNVTLFTHSNQQSIGVLIQDKDIAKTLASIHQFIESVLA